MVLLEVKSHPRLGAWLASLLSAHLLAACAGTPDVGAGESEEGRRDRLPRATGTCFYERNVRDFQALDDQRLLIHTHRDRYIVEFFGSCFGLHFAHRLAFESSGPRICDYSGDAIRFRDERCVIASIRPFYDESPEAERDREIDEEIRRRGEEPADDPPE